VAGPERQKYGSHPDAAAPFAWLVGTVLYIYPLRINYPPSISRVMSTSFSSFFPDLEPGNSLPAGMQPLGLLRDEHGAPLLRQLSYAPEQLLCVQWFGNLTTESVIAGAKTVLTAQQKLRPALLLNDKSIATGDWNDAMDWVEFEWLPLAQQYGLRAFAYVFSPDVHNQLSALEFFARVRQQLPIQLFYDVDTAHAWLREQL
jgi:hypothetical protein